MIEFLTNLHIGWWFLAHALIMVACFISLDNYNYQRTMLFAEALEDIKSKLELVESRTKYLTKSIDTFNEDEYVD